MAHASRRVRKERRQRRWLNQTNRANCSLKGEWLKTYSILMAVLVQSGGDVVVTKGTMDQVSERLPRLGYAIVKGVAENEFVVRQTYKEDVPTAGTEQESPDGATV